MRGWKVVACLAVSGAAFGVLVGQAALKYDLSALVGPAPARADIRPVNEPVPEAGPGPGSVGSVTIEEPAPEAEPVEEPAEPEVRLVEAPDLTETTALRALRTGRRAGFEIELTDEEGFRVPPSERLYMRVREGDQSPAPGTMIEPGSTIALTAAYPRAFAGGY